MNLYCVSASVGERVTRRPYQTVVSADDEAQAAHSAYLALVALGRVPEFERPLIRYDGHQWIIEGRVWCSVQGPL